VPGGAVVSEDEPSAPSDEAISEADLAKFAHDHATEIAHQYMIEGARTWKRVDGFSTWATAAAGASLGVAISQLAVIRNNLGVGMARALLWTLALSVLTGLLAKYLGFSVGVSLAMTDVNRKITETFLADKGQEIEKIKLSPKVIEKYIAPVLFLYKKKMRPAVPFILRPYADRVWSSSNLFSADGGKSGQLRWFFWQLLAVHLQLISLIVAVVIAAFAA
jgi:hypothetical protein